MVQLESTWSFRCAGSLLRRQPARLRGFVSITSRRGELDRIAVEPPFYSRYATEPRASASGRKGPVRPRMHANPVFHSRAFASICGPERFLTVSRLTSDNSPKTKIHLFSSFGSSRTLKSSRPVPQRECGSDIERPHRRPVIGMLVSSSSSAAIFRAHRETL